MGLALVCVLGVLGVGALVLTSGDRDPLEDCPVRVRAVEPLPQLVERSGLLPPGSVGAQRRRAVAPLQERGPVGQVVAGRFYESLEQVPALVAYGDRLALVSAPRGGDSTLTVVDPAAPAAESTLWSADLAAEDEAWTTFTGGLVGQAWVSVFSGGAPAVVSLDPEGEGAACVRIPLEASGADVTAVTDQAGGDVVVLASAASGWWLGVVDPATGDVGASAEGQDGRTWQSVEVAEDLVVGSRWAVGTIGTSGRPRPGDAAASWIAAWGLDGSARWTYPAEGSRPFPAVLLELADDGTAYVVAFDRGGPFLDAVSAGGDRLWRAPLQQGEWSGSVWADVLVLRGPDPAGGAMLRALDLREGAERWRVRARQAPPVGSDPRSGFGEPFAEPGAWWVPSPNGLLRIDRRSGKVDRVDTRARVDQLVRVGDHVVVRSGRAVLVTR